MNQVVWLPSSSIIGVRDNQALSQFPGPFHYQRRVLNPTLFLLRQYRHHPRQITFVPTGYCPRGSSAKLHSANTFTLSGRKLFIKTIKISELCSSPSSIVWGFDDRGRQVPPSSSRDHKAFVWSPYVRDH
jgi:hypothetical protein